MSIRVIDRGPGMSPAQLARAFEPFYRDEASDAHPGSGLGLAIVRGFVEANGGRVRAESLQGQGTVFAIELPLAERPRPPTWRRAFVSAPRSRVLVCDDELQILRGLRIVLREAGFDVVAAQSAQEALDAAALHPPEAAIIDLVLPDGDGVDVCRQLRSWSQMPIIVLSAVGDEEVKIAALDAGADDYVTKPFNPRELIARLNAVLRRVASNVDEPTIRVDGLEIDLAARSVRRDGQDVHLTPIEYDLLRILARNRGRLLTHRTLLSEVWGPQYVDDTQALRTHIANLRRKLEPRRRAALHPHRRPRRLPLHRLTRRPRGDLHTIHTDGAAIRTRRSQRAAGCCGARMAERRLQGLQRVLGVNALFATAYGNVGSSIYYALGLVAGLALGLTPLVFVITGIFFFCTAATYAEATAMFPEAGGSSSFARHAFNEFVSFFAAWAQMLNYVITVAISAFFVPHYLGGLFWEPLRSAPGDVIFGAGVIIALSLVNVVGIKESAGLNIVLALVDFATQVLMVVVGRCSSSRRRRSSTTSTSASRRRGRTSYSRSRWG